MAIIVAGSSSYTPSGDQDVSTTGATIPLPSAMAVGDYIVAAVFLAQQTGSTASAVVPSGWTIINSGNYGSASSRTLIFYGYKISNSAALTAIGTSFIMRASPTASRVVANVHRLTGVDLSVNPVMGTLETLSSATTTVTFNQPASGATLFFFLATNNSSPSLPPVISSTGGTLQVTNRSVAVAGGGATSDSQLSTLIGGTGATYSVSATNHMSYGLGFTPLVAAVITSATAGFTATAATVTFAAPIAGHGLVMVVQHQSSGSITVTDSGGNTWVRRAASELATTPAAGQYKIDIWDCLSSAIATAPTSATVTASTSSEIAATVYEISGLQWQSSATTYNSSSPTSGAPTITPAVGDLIISALAYNTSSAANTATAGAPYTSVLGSGAGTIRYDSAYFVTTSASASTAVWTVVNSTAGGGFSAANYGIAPSPTANIPPVAGFSKSNSGLTVTVTSTATDADGSIASTDYDWGDGATHGSVANTSHTYATAGTYTIIQIVTDNLGASSTLSASVTVPSGISVRPSIVGTSTTGKTTDINAKNIFISKPVVISDGDWLIAGLRSQSSTATADFTLAGWTRIGPAFLANSAGARVTGFYAKYIPLAATETAVGYTFAWTGGTGRAAGMIVRVKGADSNNLVNVSSTNYASTLITNGTTLPSLTVPDAYSLQLILAANEQVSPNASESVSHTTGFNLAQSSFSSTDTTISRTTTEMYQALQDAGSTPIFNITWAAISSRTAQSVVLRGTPLGNISPEAGFTTSTSNLTLTVTSSATDADGTITATDYDWGDSTSHGASPNTTHTYSAGGTYSVIQQVTDNGGLHSVTTVLVTVALPNVLPVASFTHSDAGLTTSVNGGGSTDSDGTIVSYDWNWGDGSAHGTGVTTIHTYASSGTYTITLVVTDNSGGTATSTGTAVVTTVVQATPHFSSGDYASNSLGSSSSIAVSKPTNTVDGDLLVAFIYSQGTTGVNPTTVPAGWTLQKGLTIRRGGIYTKYISSAVNELATSYTWAGTTGGARIVGTIFRVTNANPTHPLDVAGTEQTTSGSNTTSFTLSSVTTVYSNSLLLAFNYWNNSDINTVAVYATASGMTNGISANSPTGGTSNTSGTNIQYEVLGTSGATGTRLQTLSPAAVTVNGLMIALHSATSAPTASFTTSTVPGAVVNVDATASASTAAGATLTSYSWDWGDASSLSTGSTATHTYSASATFTITLTVTDSYGTASVKTGTFTASTTGSVPPIRIGYSFLNPGVADTTMTLDPSVISGGSAIATGYWMIITIACNTTATIASPSGWVTLQSLTTAGTLKYAVYGKMRAAGETSYVFTLDTGGLSNGATLMWGAGAEPSVAKWIVGASTSRSVSTHNTGAAVTTVADHSLILGISAERTIATETGITSVNGATEWYFMPQVGGTQLQTIDVAYVVDKTPAGATTTIDWTYPNSQAVNGMGIQIAIPPPSPGNINVGYAGVLRVGTTNYTGNLFYWDGTTARGLGSTPIVRFKPAVVSDFLSSAHSPWFSAHRGFSNSYPEETLYSYRGATDWGIHAIEVSVQKSQSGTFWCFHDSTTTRTTGFTGTISAMTDTTIAGLTNIGSTAAYNSGQPARPTAKLIDVLNLYASTHVIIIEDKTYTNTTNLLNLMDSYGTVGRPANEIFIWKADATAGAGFYSAPAARGYHRLGYIFDSSMASSFSSIVASGKMDMIGMDFNSSDATLTAAVATALANNVRPTGHIIATIAQRDRMLGLGMTGLMMSNKDAVPPWYTTWGGL